MTHPETGGGLWKKSCQPCKASAPALKGDALKNLAKGLESEWEIAGEHHLVRQYLFADFQEALRFTNLVGAIAEREGHHPDIYLAWGKVRLEIWTHSVDGLSENDFILAAKIDQAR